MYTDEQMGRVENKNSSVCLSVCQSISFCFLFYALFAFCFVFASLFLCPSFRLSARLSVCLTTIPLSTHFPFACSFVRLSGRLNSYPSGDRERERGRERGREARDIHSAITSSRFQVQGTAWRNNINKTYRWVGIFLQGQFPSF